MTASGVVYARRIDGRKLTFAFHPELYRRNLLLFDVETESTWSQLEQQAISGPLKGAQLQQVPMFQTTWKHWKSLHSDTKVMRRGDEYQGLHVKRKSRPYYYNERINYASRRGMNRANRSARVSTDQRSNHPSELVLGIVLEGVAKAYPFAELAATTQPIQDRLGNRDISIHFDSEALAAWSTDDHDQLLPSITVTWDGWRSFHTNSTLFLATPPSPPQASKSIQPKNETGPTEN